MRILLVNQYFRPDVAASAQRLSELADDLARVHRVTALVGRPSYDAAAGTGDAADRAVDVRRVPSTAFHRGRGRWRVVNYVTFLVAATLRGMVLPRPDLVVAATDPPLAGLVGWILSRRFGVPFVHLLWDVQPQVAVEAGLLRPGFIVRQLEAAGRFVARRADGVVAPTEDMAATAIAQGAAPDTVTVVGHWEDTEIVRPLPKDNAFSRAHDLADARVVMYSGNVGLTQQLGRYLDLAARMRDIPDLVFLIVGDGAGRAAVQTRVAQERLTNVRLLPYQARERMAESLATADVFLVPLAAGLTRFMLPSKIYTVMASGRPLVLAVDESSHVARLVRDLGCGVVCAPADLDAAEAHLRALLEDPARRREMGQRGRAAAEGRCSRRASTDALLQWLRRFEA